ncbi:LLM class flavin-dependent oxidoreductase [Mycolicibacter sinensis]|uniref:LLM class flavin-dependent oxidoreductase n=1 Tax=Mycolicibacter sinensis (strain JDM601) TaxID=875328 RepID=UPI002681493C
MQSIYPGKEQPYPPQMTRYLDPVLLWTVAAAATNRVRLNASTLSTFYYEPTHLARQLTTLDVLSDGRLDVGVGVGWMKDEHDIARGADWRRYSTSPATQSPRGAIVGRSDGLGGHSPVVRNSQGCIPIASARFRCSATPSGRVR